MGSLANETISSTYDGLIKTNDEQPLPASGVRLLQDGSGNNSALSIGQANQGATVTGTLTATAFSGDLTGDVTGDLTGSVLTAAQTNITSVGTLSSLTVSGALNGTLSTASQPNITSVGTLSSLAVSGNLTVDTDTLYVDATNNRVGIGTSSPAYKVDAQESGVVARFAATNGNNNQIAFSNAANAAAQFYVGSPSSNSLQFSDSSGTERMRIESGGYVRINQATTSYSLNVREDNGSLVYIETVVSGTSYLSRIYMGTPNLYIDSGGTGGVQLTNGATSWTSASDINLKKDIVELSNVLDKIDNKRCVSYRLKSQDFEQKNIGFIAQDWEDDFPEVVNVNDIDGTLGMAYTETIPILLKAIQELKAEIETLKSQINA